MDTLDIKGHQVACSGLIEKNGKYLIFFCPGFKLWRVPTGRAEFGEILESTLLREMKEETKIEFKNPLFVGFGQAVMFHPRSKKWTSRLNMFYHVSTDKEPILDPDEAEEYRWVSIDELKSIENKAETISDFFQRFPNAIDQKMKLL